MTQRNLFETSLAKFGDTRLELPELESFEYGHLEQIELPEESDRSSSTEQHHGGSVTDGEDSLEDLWQIAGLQTDTAQENGFKSWEAFLDRDHEEPPSAYISEHGPRVFDALLALQEKHTRENGICRPVVQKDVFIQSLVHLGLGRSSVFFSYDEGARKFEQLLEGCRMPGISVDAVEKIVSNLTDCGSSLRRLDGFTKLIATAVEPLPVRAALADAILTLLLSFKMQTGLKAELCTTALQLQAVFSKPAAVLAALEKLVKATTLAKTDEQIISKIYEQVAALEDGDPLLRVLLQEVLSHVARPWLQVVERWIGLREKSGFGDISSGPTFVQSKSLEWTDKNGYKVKDSDYNFDSKMMPVFMAEQDADLIFETGKGNRFLAVHHPEHPLASAHLITGEATPSLAWHFSWQDVERIQHQARRYESSLRDAVRQYTASGSKPVIERTSIVDERVPDSEYSMLENTAADYLNLTADAFDAYPSDPLLSTSHGLHDLYANSTASFDEAKHTVVDEFKPPISITPSLSFNPLVSAQARLVNAACIRLLFKSHELRLHLTIQHRYHLFSEGIFASRLSHALFDPELETTERRRGVARSGGVLGLNLGSRENWPPASSELRLALAGVLSESYYSSSYARGVLEDLHTHPVGPLPGGLSFGIRELPEDEMQKTFDPNGLEALDFLRLQYKTPRALEEIITQNSLSKYDRIFQLLLRVVRLLSVVNQLFRDVDLTSRLNHVQFKKSKSRNARITQRFRVESHHFITTLADHFLSTGIATTWTAFSKRLSSIEETLDHDSASEITTVKELRDLHDRVLDRIIFVLFLRRRQERVLAILEDIWRGILRFAWICRMKASGKPVFPSASTTLLPTKLNSDSSPAPPRGDDDADDATSREIRGLYRGFTRNVQLFLSVLRGLSEKNARQYHNKDASGIVVDDGGATVGMLLMRLEMSGYYESADKRRF